MAAIKTLNPPLATSLIHQFPTPTWIENLAVRSNGSILVTLLTTPDLYLLDPAHPGTAKLVHTFPGILALTGIIESAVAPDIFYLAGGNFNASAYSNEQGSYEVWEINLSTFDDDGKVAVRKISHIKESGLLNGMELSTSPTEVLIADSEIGCVWKVDVGTGEYSKAFAFDEMKFPPPPGLPMGINGIKLREGFLYWTNTGEKTFARVKIDGECKAIGEPEILASDCLVDDFIFDREGNAWMAQNPLNTVAVVRVGGGWDVKGVEKEVVVVAGHKDELTVPGGTAAQWGRKTGPDGDEHVLYVATTGGLAAPIKGTEIEGGKVVGIDTKSFS